MKNKSTEPPEAISGVPLVSATRSRQPVWLAEPEKWGAWMADRARATDDDKPDNKEKATPK